MTRHKNRQAKRIVLPLTGIALSLLVGLAFWLRVVPSYSDIFAGQWIKFASNDAYYYMRLVDDMIANFPHLPTVDLYLLYPSGQAIISYHLFARIIAVASWLIGLGNPSQHIVDIVGAFTPAVMGALVVLPVYFISKALWGKVAGLMSASLIAILPGEFLGRSILGFTDHHIAEVLFSTVAMLFLILAVRDASHEGVTKRSVSYCTIAGLFWGIYGLTWQGGSLFLLIACLCFIVQFVVGHLKGDDITYLCKTGVIFNLTGMIVFLPSVIGAYNMQFYSMSMGGALLLPVALWLLSRILEKIKARRVCYPVALMALGGIGLWGLSLVDPLMFGQIAGVVQFVFAPSATQLTTIEMQPLLFPYGAFTLSLAWGNFGIALYGFAIGFAMLLWDVARDGGRGKVAIIVWSGVIILMAFGQRRFAYYLAVNVALLNGYFLWKVLKWLGAEKWEWSIPDMRDRKTRKGQAAIAQFFNMVAIVSVLFVTCYLPLVPSIKTVASKAMFVPSNAWCESLDWLRENSPEPVADARTGYSVLSWWDYGYWIARIGNRMPIVNPGQDPAMQTEVAHIFMSNDVGGIRKLGSEYVIVDMEMVMGKFWAIARYAGSDQSDYFETYYVQNGNQMIALPLFYPQYYESLSVRLFNFDANAVTPQYVDTVAYEVRYNAEGKPFNLITDNKRFGSYAEAEMFVSQNSEYMIVSNSPFVSPIPLDKLDGLEMVYESTDKVAVSSVRGMSKVKIFKYTE